MAGKIVPEDVFGSGSDGSVRVSDPIRGVASITAPKHRVELNARRESAGVARVPIVSPAHLSEREIKYVRTQILP